MKILYEIKVCGPMSEWVGMSKTLFCMKALDAMRLGWGWDGMKWDEIRWEWGKEQLTWICMGRGSRMKLRFGSMSWYENSMGWDGCMKTSMRWDEMEGAMDLLFLCSYEKPSNLHYLYKNDLSNITRVPALLVWTPFFFFHTNGLIH